MTRITIQTSFLATAFRSAAPAFAAAALVALSLAHPSLAAPPNDACSGATAIPASGPFPFTTSVNTTDANDSSGDVPFPCLTKFPVPYPMGAVGKSVWFTFTPSVTDNYQIDTFGSTPAQYDTVMALFTGTCANLVPVTPGCDINDNGFDDTNGSLQSSIKVALNAGTTYTIQVGAVGDQNFDRTINPPNGGTLKFNVKRVAINYPYKYVIPSVAHAMGKTLYVSDLFVTNIEGADGAFAVQFLGHGNFGDLNPPPSQPSLNPINIAALGSKELGDILGTSFNLSSDYGAIVVSSTRKLLVGAKTSTTGPAGGTFSQFALAYDMASEQLAYQETGRFNAVRDDAAFRTNIAVFNTTNTVCAVDIKVFDGLGLVYASGARTPFVPPNSMAQISGLRNYFGITDDIRNAHIEIRNVGTGCTVGAVAYVIDQTTQDPYAVQMKK